MNEHASRRTQKRKEKKAPKKNNFAIISFSFLNILAFASLLLFGIDATNKQQKKLDSIEQRIATLDKEKQATNTATTTSQSTTSSAIENTQETTTKSSSTQTEESAIAQVQDSSEEKRQELAETQTESTSYTVQSGDTLSTIAERNNLTVQDLMTKNNLTDDIVYIGQTLKIK